MIIAAPNSSCFASASSILSWYFSLSSNFFASISFWTDFSSFSQWLLASSCSVESITSTSSKELFLPTRKSAIVPNSPPRSLSTGTCLWKRCLWGKPWARCIRISLRCSSNWFISIFKVAINVAVRLAFLYSWSTWRFSCSACLSLASNALRRSSIASIPKSTKSTASCSWLSKETLIPPTSWISASTLSTYLSNCINTISWTIIRILSSAFFAKLLILRCRLRPKLSQKSFTSSRSSNSSIRFTLLSLSFVTWDRNISSVLANSSLRALSISRLLFESFSSSRDWLFSKVPNSMIKESASNFPSKADFSFSRKARLSPTTSMIFWIGAKSSARVFSPWVKKRIKRVSKSRSSDLLSSSFFSSIDQSTRPR